MPALPRVQELAGSATRTGNGTSYTLNVGCAREVSLAFQVTAITGTGARIGFDVQFAMNAAGPWWTDRHIVRATAAGTLLTSVLVRGVYLRVLWYVYGTDPQITFSINSSRLEV